jgi:hypothetical protein
VYYTAVTHISVLFDTAKNKLRISKPIKQGEIKHENILVRIY